MSISLVGNGQRKGAPLQVPLVGILPCSLYLGSAQKLGWHLPCYQHTFKQFQYTDRKQVGASKNTSYANASVNGWGSLEANIILKDTGTSPLDLFTQCKKRQLTAPLLEKPTLKHIDSTVNTYQFYAIEVNKKNC